MLKKLERQDFDRYVEFAYALALDTTKSGYPTYADGIKTKDDFITRALRAFSDDNEGILLYERDGKISGWIHYYHIPEDHYLDTCSFCVAEGVDKALEEFTAFAQERFPGNELYLGFPKENLEAAVFLNARGFELIEESYNDALDLDRYTLRPENKDVIPITRDNYQLFSAVHSQHDNDMYWNSGRILGTIDSWRIFVFLQKGAAAGAIYFRFREDDMSMSEVFGVDFPDGVYDRGVYRDLLTAVLNHEKRRGVKHMVFFHDEESHPDALACGFRCIGKYVCFKTKL